MTGSYEFPSLGNSNESYTVFFFLSLQLREELENLLVGTSLSDP